MADEAKVPTSKAPVTEQTETVEIPVVPTRRARFAAFRNDEEVKALEGKVKPTLRSAAIIVGAMALAPEATAFVIGGAAAQRGVKMADRVLARHYAAKTAATDTK